MTQQRLAQLYISMCALHTSAETKTSRQTLHKNHIRQCALFRDSLSEY